MKWALAGLAVLVVVGAFLIAYARGRNVDREEYVRENVAVLSRVPVYPGAVVDDTRSSPCKESEQDFARTLGYYTSRRYVLPEGTRAQDVIAFMRRELRGWRIVDASPAPSLSITQSRAYGHILAGDDDYSVSVDHDRPGCPGA
jgi:hypothetical protein